MPPRCLLVFSGIVGVTASRHGAPHSREAPSLARASYFARFHTTSSTVPIWEAGLVYRNSSAVIELMIRFWVPPFKFGSEAASTFVVRVFVASSIDHVPNWAVIPWTLLWLPAPQQILCSCKSSLAMAARLNGGA